MSTPSSALITLTPAEANSIADTLLAGCFLATEAERTAQCDLSRASASNTYVSLRDAMLLLEGKIAASDADPMIEIERLFEECMYP